MASNCIEKENDLNQIITLFTCENSDHRSKGVTSFMNFLDTRVGNVTPEECHEVFENCYVPLLSLLRDPSDIVREETITCINQFYMHFLPRDKYYLKYLIPILRERIDDKKEIERSEDVRVALMNLLSRILAEYRSDQLRQFTGDIIQIVSGAMNDQNDKMTIVCLDMIDLLFIRCPIEMEAMGSNLKKPLLDLLLHPNNELRIPAVHTIGELGMATTVECIETLAAALTVRVYDFTEPLRKKVAQVGGKWLMEHPNRYSNFHLLIPILLPFLLDKSAGNRYEAEQLWSSVGDQYYQENEAKFRAEFDYWSQEIENYPLTIRQPFGCGKLVQDTIHMMMPNVYEGLLCNIQLKRFHCTNLLHLLVLHVEEGIAPFLPQVFLGMLIAIEEHTANVEFNIIQSAKLIGCFVKSQIWGPIILHFLREHCTNGHLAILSALILGVRGRMSSDVLLDIASKLATPLICQTREVDMRVEIMNCTKALLRHYRANVDAVCFSECIFNVIVCLASIQDGTNSYKIDLLDDLKRVVYIDDLWGLHTEQLLYRFNKDPKTWHEEHEEFWLFSTILESSRGVLGKNMEKIVLILRRALHADVPASCRLKTLTEFANALGREQFDVGDANENVQKLLANLILEYFVPALTWKPCPIEERLRCTVNICIQIFLAQDQFVNMFKTQQELFDILATLMPVMLSLLSEENYETRMLAVDNIMHMKKKLAANNKWTDTYFIQLYPAILKLLHDPENEVVSYAFNVLKYILDDVPVSFCAPIPRGHHEYIVDALFVHLGHENTFAAATALDILKKFSDVNSKLVQDKAMQQIVASCARNKACRKLLDHTGIYASSKY